MFAKSFKFYYLEDQAVAEYVSDLARLLFLLRDICTALKWKHTSAPQANSALKLFLTPFLLLSGDGRVGSWRNQCAAQSGEE